MQQRSSVRESANRYDARMTDHPHPMPNARPVRTLTSLIAVGAATGVLSSILLAALVGTCFRFPVPFAGYQHGPGHIPEFLVAAVLYLVAGGVVPQAVMGSFAGALAFQITRLRGGSAYRLAMALAITCALPGVLLLSMLDWMIGHW
jgi:hypothetical protein